MSKYREYSEPHKDYIEKSTCSFNDDSNTNSSDIETANLICRRWAWLTEEWDNMTYEQKCELFFPIVHYINVKDRVQSDFDSTIAKEITQFGLKKCRSVQDIQYNFSRDGVPTYTVIYNPINYKSIPNADIRNKVYSFGIMNGFIGDGTVTINCE